MNKPDPTDEDIIRAMTTHGSRAMTYVIRNVLWTNGFRRETPWIRRQLERMERAGRVYRVPTSYAVQICWAVASVAPTPEDRPPPSALAPAWEGSSMWTDWQAQAQKHIAKFMADVPATATWQERQRILRANAWQFTGGTSWGKRVWAKHCKAYLAMHGKPMGAKEAERKEPLFAADITFPFRAP